MSMFLRKKWLLPSITNSTKPHEPSAQILRFFDLPGEKDGNAFVLLSDKFNSIGAVLTVKALAEFKKDHPGFTELRNLKGGIIALITYCFKPDKNWENFVIETDKFNYICNSEPVGDPILITNEDVEQALNDYKRGGNEDNNPNNFSQASQLVEMADLLSQVDDSVNQSVKRTTKKADLDEMELSESDFIIPEDQKKQLDRIPGWVDEELSQAPPSQAASVNTSLLPTVSQSVHKSPAKVPTEFYRGQLPLQLAVDGSIEDSEEDNQSKDQDQMNVEKDVLGDDRPQQSSEGAANANNNDSSPTKDNLAKVDDTFDDETQGPEEMASYNVQTQSLPMTLSTGDLAKSSEKPAEPAPASEPNNATPASETPKKKKKSGSKKKKAEKPPSSDVEPAETSSQKSNRSTRSKKKTAKNSSSASTNENADTEKTKEKSKSKKKSDKTKESTKDKAKDKNKDKAKDKTKDKDTKEKKKKDKTPKEKKKKKTSAATDSSSGTVSSTNTSLVAPEPTTSQEAPPKPAEQVEQPAAQPTAELPAPTTTDAPNNAPILIQETVVLHDQPVEVDKDPNKIYDEQNHSIPNLNDDDMDAMMMSFHQELESASQLDLNAVPDYIVDVSPEKSSYPLIRDLGSPLITSHTSSQAPASQQAGFHFGHSNQEFSLGMPSDASSQARNVAPSQASADVAINNNNMNNASEGSEDNAGKSSSSISQELISGTMRNLPSPEKDQSETPAKEKHSLLEEMLMSDPAEANNITDSQADNNNEEEYFTQHPDLLGDSESQWEGSRIPATQGVVPVVPQSQGDLHSEFFSSSDDSGKDKQSQNAGQNTNAMASEPKDANENNVNVTPTSSPSGRKDSISPKARRHLEFNLDKDAPSSPTKSQPAPSSQKSSTNRFKFSLPKTSTLPQKRINLSTQPQTQLPRVIATSPPKFKRPAAKSPPKENAPAPSSVNNNSPTKAVHNTQASTEARLEKRIEKEIENQVEQEVNMVTDNNNSADDDDIGLEITSEQRPPDHDSPPPLIRVNSTDLHVDESRQQRERSRSKSPSPQESKSKSKSREEKDDKLKYVIDLEDLSPRFFNKTKKATENNTNKARSKERSGSGSGPSSQETTASPQNRTPVAIVKKTDKKSPSPNSRPGSLGDLIRQSRQQSLASTDPTMEFVIGYFKEVTSEPKPAPAKGPKFSSNTNSNSSGSSSTAGVKRKIDYYGWLDLTSNKKRKIDNNDNRKKK